METTTEQVWETFHVPLQQFIRRRVSDDATAEDLLQDVFLDIHQHIDALRFELDRRGHIIDYQPRCVCCSTGDCCAEVVIVPTRSARVRPF